MADLAELRAAFEAARTEGLERRAEAGSALAVALADDYQDDELRSVLDELARDLRGDRELAIRVYRGIVAELRARFETSSVPAVLHLAAEAARGDASPAGLARWIELAVELAVAHIDDLERARADAVIDELFERTKHDPELAIDFRRALAAALAGRGERELACVQVRAALEVATTDDRRVGLAAELVGMLLDDGQGEAVRVAVSRWAPLADALVRSAPTPERLAAAAGLHLAMARATGAEDEARSAAELARASGQLALRHATARCLAELLADRGALAEAAAWLAALPAADDELATRAVLEEIRRKLGTLDEEPPPELLADDPAFALFATADIDPELLAFFTPPTGSGVDHLRAHGLASSEKIRAWSHGRVSTEADLESEQIFGPRRSYVCGCGRYRGNVYRGVICERCGVEVIGRRSRAIRPAHIVLREPVAHPWFVTETARLLQTSELDVRAGDGAELRRRLGELDLFGTILELERVLEETRAEKRRRPLELRLAVAHALDEAHADPRSLALELIPVLPPEAEVGIDRERLRAAYAGILEDPHPPRAVARLFACFGRE